MERAAGDKPANGIAAPPGSTLISGHDTNVSNLSGLLGLSWQLPSYQLDDVPPGAAVIFSLWQSGRTNRYYARLQFMAQTLTQMHEMTPLSLANPPAIASLFVPGCSTARDGFSCEWSRFRRVLGMSIDPEAVVR